MVSVYRITGTVLPSTFRLAKLALICVTLLSGDQFMRLALAEDTGGVPSPPNLIYPEGSEITFQWIYHCPRGTHCVFSCGPTSANAATDNNLSWDSTDRRQSKSPGAILLLFDTGDPPQ